MENFIEPKMAVLSEESLVPEKNLIAPPPNQFTHRLKKAQPYYFSAAQPSTPPNGTLAEGTKVVLMTFDGGAYCRVVDERGLYVEIAFEDLEKL